MSLIPKKHQTVYNGNVAAVKALLVVAETHVDKRCERGHTALQIAVENRQVDIVRVLFSAGAQVDGKELSGSTARRLRLTMAKSI